MKNEPCKVYSRDFWIFLRNIIKIDHYNSELYRFKVGAFFETQCIVKITALSIVDGHLERAYKTQDRKLTETEISIAKMSNMDYNGTDQFAGLKM